MTGKAAVIGLGLIGGSLGLALAHSFPELRVEGCDFDANTEKMALEMGCVHKIGTVDSITTDADVIFLCTPVSVFPSMLEQILPHCKPGCIITDVGSTKQAIAGLFEDLPNGIYGIGGHPMAGSERKGITAADRYLFENAVYVLTPGSDTPREKVQQLENLLTGIGCHVIIMDAVRHDSIVAAVSHLPHIVASALVVSLKGEEEALVLAAGGFRDTTRIAGGDPDLWTDIILDNRFEIAKRMRRFINLLESTAVSLETADGDAVRRFLETASSLRDTLPKRTKGLLPSLQDVICLVPDRPGIIGELGTWMGQAGVNISDIEVLRVREGDGGTIRMAVASEDEGITTVEVLKKQGVKAWLRS